MSRKKGILSLCGTVLAMLSTLFHVIGFSTPHWLESFKQAKTRFDNLGLWSACFNHFGYDRDYLGKEYDGCHWIYSYEYRPIFDWLNPQWLLCVQIVMALVLIINIVTCALCVLGRFERVCPPSSRATSQFINSMFMFISGFMIAFSVSLFGIKANVDRQWIPRPDQNFLSWSFGFVVVGGFFAFFSAMCLLFDSISISYAAEKKKRISDPYMDYKMKPVAPVNY